MLSVRRVQARGVPIDGVGLQLHIQHTFSSFDGVATNMARLGALGLDVHVPAARFEPAIHLAGRLTAPVSAHR